MNYLLLDTLPGLEGALIGSIEPFLALSHVAMALVLGMLAATQRGKSYWAIPAAFITGTIIGMLVYFERGRWLVHHARDAVSFGLLVVCVMVIVGRSLPLLVTVAVAAASGSGYGYLLAMEIPLDGRHTVFIIMYTIGYASTFAALMGIGAVVTMVLRRHPRAPLYLRSATILLLLVGAYFVLDALSCRSNVFCRPLLQRDLFAMFGS